MVGARCRSSRNPPASRVFVEEPSGKPRVRLTGRAAEVAARLGVVHVEVSIAHTRDTAVAVAVALGAGVGGGKLEGCHV